MDDKVDAIIRVKVPKWQIGEEVSVYFPDTMTVRGKCETVPQGKWKITDSYPHKVYCNKCFKTYAQANWDVWKDGTLARDFCPNCGAKMKGGAE